MLKDKIQNPKSKIQISNTRTNLLLFVICALSFICHLCFVICHLSYAQEQFVYDAKGRRDPFIPLVTPDGRLLKLDKEEAQADLSVEGIIYDKHGRSFVIVNGSVVGIGDMVGDYQVLKIEEKKVIFIKDGQTQEVELKKEEE